MSPPARVTKVSLSIVSPPCPAVFVNEVTKVSPPSMFPPCPGGVARPRNDKNVAIYRVPTLPKSTPAQVVFPALEVTEVSRSIVLPPAQVVFPALEVTKMLLFPPLPRWCFPPSRLPPKCCYLSCSPPLAHVAFPALEVAKMLLFFMSPPRPGGGPCPRSHQSVATYHAPPPAWVVFPGLDFTKVLLFIVLLPLAQVRFPAPKCPCLPYSVFLPLPRWCSPTSKSAKCRYLSCSRPCPDGGP